MGGQGGIWVQGKGGLKYRRMRRNLGYRRRGGLGYGERGGSGYGGKGDWCTGGERDWGTGKGGDWGIGEGDPGFRERRGEEIRVQQDMEDLGYGGKGAPRAGGEGRSGSGGRRRIWGMGERGIQGNRTHPGYPESFRSLISTRETNGQSHGDCN